MFTYFSSGCGALLLGLSTTNFLKYNGRTVGMSGILVGSLFSPSSFNLPFLGGMAAALYSCLICAPNFVPAVPSLQAVSLLKLFLSSALAGIGANLASGCTSGHMLCGSSRLSPRSLVATATFMLTAILTTAISHPTLPGTSAHPAHELQHPDHIGGWLAFGIAVFLLNHWTTSTAENLGQTKQAQRLISFVSGCEFALGLLISGLADSAKIHGFLALLPPNFDPSLMMVILLGIIPSALWYNLSFKKASKPICVPKLELTTTTAITGPLIYGAAIFGVGWGLFGVCPAPAFLTALHSKFGLLWMISFVSAYLVTGKLSAGLKK